MKKLIRPLTLLIMAAAAVTLSVLSASGSAALSAPESAPSAESAEIYTLRAVGGGVGVFRADGGSQVSYADVELSALRAVDRDMLERGVSVGSWDEVLRLLEDFTS